MNSSMLKVLIIAAVFLATDVGKLSSAATTKTLWMTDAGKRALELRRQLRDLGWYDELPENWTVVESALAEGCQHFTHSPSRVECLNKRCRESTDTVTKWRVLPIAEPVKDGQFTPWNQRTK